MHLRRIAGAGLCCSLGLIALPHDAEALVIARVTRHGYIMVDEPDAPAPYGAQVPAGGQERFQFMADVTNAIADHPDAPHGEYLAIMQTHTSDGPGLAYYESLRNDVTGIGMVSPLGGGTRETFDLNPLIGTAFPLTGFVWLNSFEFYITPGSDALGRTVICPQEFGHRYGPKIRIPAFPGAVEADAGVDAGMPDAGVDAAFQDTDANGDDAAALRDGELVDAALADVTPSDGGPGLAVDSLLGRQRAHWSYFVHSGGSPMEGNNWDEFEPGVFRTGPVSFRFSMLDLYLMGIALPSEVPPFFIIADPNVGGQRDDNGRVINRESPPSRTTPVTIRGRRVTYTIDDIIRANGRRVPAYVPDGGRGAPADLPVMWVLLARPNEVSNRLADQFDRGIETCSGGYSDAAGDRSHLVAIAAPASDGGIEDAGTDTGTGRPDVSLPVDVARSDVSAADERPAVNATGGCGCAVPGGDRSAAERHSGLIAAASIAGLIASRRRRRTAIVRVP